MCKPLLFCIIITSFSEISNRDPASEQLAKYYREQSRNSSIQTEYGVPVDSITSSLRAGPNGPLLIQHTVFFDTFGKFDRERIPERVVHAKGAGAFGYFEVTDDITTYSKAIVFEKVGKRTRLAVRFSTVIGERGSPDTVRDPRGFAIKFYTEDGIWDLVGNNTPIFFVRDPLRFPQFIHSQKRNPVTNLKDADSFWDFITLQPETTHQVLRLFSALGTPDGYRHMNGYGSHTFKMVNHKRNPVYVKFHIVTDQGIRNLTSKMAEHLAVKDPDYATRDLYNAIEEYKFPSWTMYIQVMTFKQAESFHWNPFDITKIWPEDTFPLKRVGKIVLNENPKNYFSDVEQIGFSPAHMIPGIETSPDPMLQGRMFSYDDTQRHRLGANFLQIPVNCPFKVTNYQRDGPMNIKNQNGAPNYYPNSFGGPENVPGAAISEYSVTGDVKVYNSSDEDNFSQPKMFWQSLSAEDKLQLIENIVGHVKNAAPFLQERTIQLFRNVAVEFGAAIKEGLSLVQSST